MPTTPLHCTRRAFLKTLAASTTLALAPESGSAARSAPEPRSPVIDTHMHVWADDPARYPFHHPYQPDFQKPPSPATVEMLLDDMDRSGVTHCVLVQVIYHGWDNSYVADCVQKHPKRLKAHGLIDPEGPAVAEKLEYWMRERGLAGMRFSPIYYRGKDGWLDAQSSHALWKKAAELGAIFNFFISTEQLPKLEAMVRSHPEVTVIIDHLSQIDLKADDPLPEMKKLLALARYPKVFVKVSELTSVSRSGKYPFTDAYPWVRRVYDAFGADRLLWGTGYPGAARGVYKRPTLDDELRLVRERIPFFSDSDREKILGRNAAKLWGFE